MSTWVRKYLVCKKKKKPTKVVVTFYTGSETYT